MGIKKIKELVSKVKEVKNIFTKKKIESPYDKVTIHIKDVASVGCILHPEFLKALIKAVKAVEIGRASALNPLKEKWGKLKDPFVKILEFLIEQYNDSKNTNENFISNEALEALTNDISSLMEKQPNLKELEKLFKKQSELSGLNQKIDECTATIEKINQTINNKLQSSKAFLEKVKEKIKEEYNQYLSQEEEKLSKNSIAAPIDFINIRNLAELAKYITELQKAAKKISDQCNKLAYDGLEAFNTGGNQQKTKDTELHDLTKHENANPQGFRIVNMFKNWELKVILHGQEYTNKKIEDLNKKLKQLEKQIKDYNRKIEEKNTEVKKLASFSDFDSMLGKTYNAKDANKLPTAYIYLYKIINGDAPAEEKTLKTCLTAVCDARKGSFDAKEILNAVAVVYKRLANPLEKKLKELEKHENTKKDLDEELAKVKDGLEKVKKEIENLLTLVKPMLTKLTTVLKTNTRCLDDKLLTATKVRTSLNYLKGYLVPVEKIIEEDLKIRNEEYRTNFKKSVSEIKKASDYGNTMPLLMFVMAFCQYLTNIMTNVNLRSEKNLCTIEKTLYDASFACYDLGMPVMNDIIQKNFISAAKKFIPWIQSFIELTENSSEINTKGCMELLESYENHPYRNMLLKVQKNK